MRMLTPRLASWVSDERGLTLVQDETDSLPRDGKALGDDRLRDLGDKETDVEHCHDDRVVRAGDREAADNGGVVDACKTVQ